jgi:hypothetical protein
MPAQPSAIRQGHHIGCHQNILTLAGVTAPCPEPNGPSNALPPTGISAHTVSLDGQPVPMYDLMGKDATMFHHEQGDDPSSVGGQFVARAQAWFDSMWATVSRAYP